MNNDVPKDFTQSVIHKIMTFEYP